MHFLVTRILTGVVGISLAAAIIQFGGLVYALAVLFLLLVGWYEYAQAFKKQGTKAALGEGFAAVFFLWGCAWLGNAEEYRAVALFFVLLILSKAVLQHKNFSVAQACISVTGIFYVGFTMTHLLLLRFFDEVTVISTAIGDFSLGCALLWLALLGTWASDTFAYFSGCLFGRHKLCPEISPKKTVEGFVGGLLGTMLTEMAVGYMFSFSLLHMCALGLGIGLLAPLGDLVESIVKRYTGIKDSGNIFPGHGGVLDRFDSVMFSVPFVYYYAEIFKVMQ